MCIYSCIHSTNICYEPLVILLICSKESEIYRHLWKSLHGRSLYLCLSLNPFLRVLSTCTLDGKQVNKPKGALQKPYSWKAAWSSFYPEHGPLLALLTVPVAVKGLESHSLRGQSWCTEIDQGVCIQGCHACGQSSSSEFQTSSYSPSVQNIWMPTLNFPTPKGWGWEPGGITTNTSSLLCPIAVNFKLLFSTQQHLNTKFPDTDWPICNPQAQIYTRTDSWPLFPHLKCATFEKNGKMGLGNLRSFPALKF